MGKRSKRHLSRHSPKRRTSFQIIHAQDRKAKMRIFAAAIRLQMDKHGDTPRSLIASIETRPSERSRTVRQWMLGVALPRFHRSFHLLRKIEQRYGLPKGFFEELVISPESETAKLLKSVRIGDQKIFRWHLPRSFERKPPDEQVEIVEWIRSNVLGCNTEYGHYLRKVYALKYAMRFPGLLPARSQRPGRGTYVRHSRIVGAVGGYGNIDAPERLMDELAALLSFKTEVMPPPKMSRYLRWSEASAKIAVNQYGQLFGALASAPRSQASGIGLPLRQLSFGLLVFPSVWNWYLGWRERRRGFFTLTEQNLLYEIKAMSRDPTGWLRQNKALANRIKPIPGLVSAREVQWAKRNWEKANDKLFRFACDRIPEMLRAKKVHRDPFAPILSVLNNDCPLGEYKRIADEILRQLQNKNQSPIVFAHAVRAYLMVRITIHLGVRQKNVRELLLCKRGEKPRSEIALQHLKRGELSWSEKQNAWQILIPAEAFKNSRSSFFRNRPFKLVLPNLERLNFWIETYITKWRNIILGPAVDPGTFLVKSIRSTSSSAEFDVYSFYETWKYTIQRYGIYNPYTRRGAIKGLLPHGPHCIRDVLATHILKRTESYEIASFAIQDTVESVIKHYARFLPHEKSARAAEVLNKEWKS